MVAIIIPARMASTRFPGKPLCDLLGKPMVQWVYEASVASGIADTVLIATPDQVIVDACTSFNGEAVLTSDKHQSGTDRLAEVAEKVDAEVYVNVQGDEPLIRPDSIRACAMPLIQNSSIQMGSLFSLCPEEELGNPSVVKVVTDQQGYALYFSRYALPYPRNPRKIPVKKHIGIYAYRKKPLVSFALWPMGDTEAAESLEQLRFLEHGVRIYMAKGEGSEMAVDTPEQAEQVKAILERRKA